MPGLATLLRTLLRRKETNDDVVQRRTPVSYYETHRRNRHSARFRRYNKETKHIFDIIFPIYTRNCELWRRNEICPSVGTEQKKPAQWLFKLVQKVSRIMSAPSLLLPTCEFTFHIHVVYCRATAVHTLIREPRGFAFRGDSAVA